MPSDQYCGCASVLTVYGFETLKVKLPSSKDLIAVAQVFLPFTVLKRDLSYLIKPHHVVEVAQEFLPFTVFEQ